MSELEQIKQQVVLNAKCIQELKMGNDQLHKNMEDFVQETKTVVKDIYVVLNKLNRQGGGK